MRCQLVLVTLGVLVICIQAFAPLHWQSQVLMPKNFVGRFNDMAPPQQLIIKDPLAIMSRNMIPHFSATLDHRITWDDMGWCLEAGGSNADLVQLNRCHSGPAQKWNWIPDGHGRNMIQLKNSNRCLDVTDTGLVELRECAYRATRAWRFEEPIPVPTPVSFDMRHAMVSLIVAAGLSALSLSAWFWQRRSKSRMVKMKSMQYHSTAELSIFSNCPDSHHPVVMSNTNNWWQHRTGRHGRTGELMMEVDLESDAKVWFEVADLPSPSDALIIEGDDRQVWNDEVLEFNGLRSDPRTPASLQTPLKSFSVGTKYYHAFDGKGKALKEFDWANTGEDGGRLTDKSRVRLIMGLLEGVSFWHSRSSGHLGLDASSIRIITNERCEVELRIVGLGAAVQLNSPAGRLTYQMQNSISFHAPETLLASVGLQTSLKGNFELDAWSVGVLIVMIAGSMNQSPFEAGGDRTRGGFTEAKAVGRRITEAQSEVANLLTRMDARSNGFVFRHEWVINMIVGLLDRDPSKRLSVYDAWRIAAKETSLANKPSRSRETDSGDGSQEQQASKRISPNELSRFREVANSDNLGKEPFRSLEGIINIIDRGGALVHIEDREKWKDIQNYGEVIGFRNRADGDRWDVFVPGLDKQLPFGEPLQVSAVLGVLLVKGGNHKIIVLLHHPHEATDQNRISDNIRRFIEVYGRGPTKAARLKYLSYDQLGY